jgi:PhzF family phenazine biosynthesis protein
MILYHVDAFTKTKFAGNPAGVCIISDTTSISDEFLQNIALEMNLSETAFIIRNDNEYHLRWFTPVTEVDFCGHATLASAHILWELNIVDTNDPITFYTKSGKFIARFINGKIELNLPAGDVIEVPLYRTLVEAFGVNPLFVGIDGKRCLIEVTNYYELITINPNFELLKQDESVDFIVTCKSDNERYDFYSRFFAPAIGVNEDPVTGLAHTYLAPYWSKKLNKSIMKAYQASKRGGDVECEVIDNKRVLLRGNAVTVFRIEMKDN